MTDARNFNRLFEAWDIRKLSEDVTLISGQHVMARDVNTHGKGAAYLTGPADFPDGVINQTKFTLRPLKMCQRGDILVTVKGSGAGSLVRADREYCISRQLMSIRPNKWNARFVYYSLLQNASRIKEASAGLIPGLSRSDILDQSLPIPPSVIEQDRIGLVIRDCDDLIASLERLIAKKRAIKQGMMQQLLTGRTRLPGFADEWQTSTLGEVGVFLKGRGVKRDDVRPSGVACIRYGELYTDFENYTATARSFVDRDVAATALPIRSGDLLFAGSGETREEIGICVAYVGESLAVAGGDIVVLRGEGFNSVFLATLMNLPSVANQKARAGQGDAVVHINSTALSSIVIDLPTRGEQDAIAKILVDADCELNKLQSRLVKARAIKTGMMQQLLTGRTRLPVEVAS